MTIFLCILTLLALCAMSTITGTNVKALVAVNAMWMSLVLGLATLACWSWWVR